MFRGFWLRFKSKPFVCLIAPIGGSSLFFRYGEKLLQKAGKWMADKSLTIRFKYFCKCKMEFQKLLSL